MKSIVLAIVLGCVLTLSASAQENGDASQSKIIALEKAWNQAYKLRDTKAIAAILDDNIVIINDDGSLQSKAEFLAGVNAAKSSDDQQVSPESLTVHMVGNVGIATGTFRVKDTEEGEKPVKTRSFCGYLGAEKRQLDMRFRCCYFHALDIDAGLSRVAEFDDTTLAA